MKKGKVYLIGAGPGDPELLTLKGKRCLEEADVVVGDYLADKRLLRFMNPEAEYIYVGKKAGNHTMKQHDISLLLAEKGKEGKVVARLKGGDPFVFGRGGEEIEVLKEAGVPFEEVPGVTSAIAAPAYAGIPVTHRKIAASFAVITGHEDPTKNESSIHWDKLAGGVDTLIFLMGVSNTAMIASQLIKYGRSKDTPAAFVRWGTRPYQETYTTTLENASEDVKKLGIKPPAVFIVGDVVNLRQDMRWFDNRPLFGKRIIVTRSRSQASRLVDVLNEKGAETIEIPTIAIKEPSDNYKGMDEALEHISTYDWLLFTSQNGVDYFFKRLYDKGMDTRALGHLKIGAIGPATARWLARHGIMADCVPEKYKAENLLAVMKPLLKGNEKILLARAKVARSVLPEGLRDLGCSVDVVEAYQTVSDEENKEKLIEILQNHDADMITFTSSSTVYNLMNQLDGKGELLKGVTLACIGPITADTCRKYNLEPSIISKVFTIDGLVHAIEEGVSQK
jgi:uroporphyrinogen III methyltransferase/synthase